MDWSGCLLVERNPLKVKVVRDMPVAFETSDIPP